jgi:hypothetical protein
MTRLLLLIRAESDDLQMLMRLPFLPQCTLRRNFWALAK